MALSFFPLYPHHTMIDNLPRCDDGIYTYIYIDSSLSSVSMGRNTQAIRHFWNGLQIFARIDCVGLQQQVIRLYIFEYSLIIMVNARWLTRQRIWSGRIGNLHISMVCSSLHGREGRSQQSSLEFKATWTRSVCWKQSWFWQGKEGVFYTTIEKF